MKKYAFRDVAEVVGVISIIVGLLLVAFELRQNSLLMEAQVFNERSAQGINVFLAVAQNRDLSAIDIQLRADGFPDNPTAFSELNLTQQNQYRWLLRADRFRLENILYQQEIGVMDIDEGHLGGAKVLLKKYQALQLAGYPFQGEHAPTGRLERLIKKIESK